MNKSTLYSFLLVLVLIILISLFSFYYKKYVIESSQEDRIDKLVVFNKKYTEVNLLNRLGKQKDALKGYELLLESAPDKVREGELKILIAANLFAQNNGGDRIRAVSMLKGVLNDFTAPPAVRALAANEIAGLVNGQDISFYKLYFPEEPFKSFLGSSGDVRLDVADAYLAILKLSDGIFPNSYAEYAIAGNYYVPLIANQKIKGESNLIEAAKAIEHYIKSGDSKDDKYLYAPHVFLRALFFRVLGLSNQERILKNLTKADIENSYQSLIEKDSSEEYQDYLSTLTLMRARFFYSVFLMRNYGEKRHVDIVDVLKQFSVAQGDNPQFLATKEHFSLILKDQSNIVYNYAKQLADISPDFRQFLLGLGWDGK